MKLSIKSLAIAAALLGALRFLFVSLLNLILPPYGGAFLALLTSLYVGYDPMARPVSLIIGTLYSLLAGAVAGALFGWLYNRFVEKFLCKSWRSKYVNIRSRVSARFYKVIYGRDTWGSHGLAYAAAMRQ